MNPEDALNVIAELSITIAGFTGLIISMRPKSAANWSHDEIRRVTGVVATCLVVTLCSVLPYALSGLGLASIWVWSVPLIIVAVYTIVLASSLLIANLRGNYFFVIKPVTYTLFAIATISAVACLLSGFGIWSPQSKGLLVFHLAWLLLVAAASLSASIALIFSRYRGESIQLDDGDSKSDDDVN